MRVIGVRMELISTIAEAGETQIRSRAKTGNAVGKVRINAVLPRRVWSQRKGRPVGNHSLKSVNKITVSVRFCSNAVKSFLT